MKSKQFSIRKNVNMLLCSSLLEVSVLRLKSIIYVLLFWSSSNVHPLQKSSLHETPLTMKIPTSDIL